MRAKGAEFRRGACALESGAIAQCAKIWRSEDFSANVRLKAAPEVIFLLAHGEKYYGKFANTTKIAIENSRRMNCTYVLLDFRKYESERCEAIYWQTRGASLIRVRRSLSQIPSNRLSAGAAVLHIAAARFAAIRECGENVCGEHCRRREPRGIVYFTDRT